jgi:hypothetical protein
MRRMALVLVSVLTGACATAHPHPPIGVMWGYLGTAANLPSVEILGYAPDRPSCEFGRAMAQTRTGVPVPSQLSARCEQVAVLPYRDGAESVYWVFSTQSDAEQFAAGGNDRSFCASFRQEALKVLRRGDTLSECEPVIVKRVT